jgi:hypothetical protein
MDTSTIADGSIFKSFGGTLMADITIVQSAPPRGLARLAERSVIALAVPFRRWAEELDRSPNFQIQPYTIQILFESVSLRSLRDPGDRRYSKASALPIDRRRLNDSPRKVDRDPLGLAQ